MPQVVTIPASLRFDDPRYSQINSSYDEGLAEKELLELEYLHGELLEQKGQYWEIVSFDHDLEERAYLYLDGTRIYAEVFSIRENKPSFTIISPKQKEAAVLAMLPDNLTVIAA